MGRRLTCPLGHRVETQRFGGDDLRLEDDTYSKGQVYPGLECWIGGP